MDKVVLSSSKVDICKICSDSNYKLTGGEARILLTGGGAETGFHHMNAHAVNLKIKNREALNYILKNLVDLEFESQVGSSAVQALMCKIAILRELSPSDAANVKSEDVDLELSSLIDAASTHSEEVDKFRDEIVVLGQDAVKLYTGSDLDIQVDPIMIKIMEVFEAFKALYLPVLVASSEDPDDLLYDIGGHSERTLTFLQAVRKSNLNSNLGQHSDYMHALIAPQHFEFQCRHLITEHGTHITHFCAEPSEANHKIMRGVLTRLQGFSARAVGNVTSQRFKSDVTFNKILYLMHDSYLRIFHYFDTLIPKYSPSTCGICSSFDHNQRRCKQCCPLCNNYYFRGHSKKTCRLLDLPLSPTKNSRLLEI